ncbi:hypothetical protein [Pendulispora albinea]|uniref:Uncharacterized protein n=1 Tax=Pendulispora albinea TaxID=2741071 RepID=A0ABZ2LT56_9BACT
MAGNGIPGVAGDLETALQLLRAAVKLAPPLLDWLHDLIEGRADPLSVRVKTILPELSQSRALQYELERREAEQRKGEG